MANLLTAGNIASASSAAGSLFQGLFGAQGDSSEADAYGKAAAYANQNAIIAKESGAIKLEQAGRKIYKTLGAQGAGYAAAGLTGGGTAQDVLRDSVSQGALEKAIVNEQTQINVTGYKEQAAQFQGMQAAANAAAAASAGGGIFGAITSIAGIVGAPFTGGASLALTAATSGLSGGGLRGLTL